MRNVALPDAMLPLAFGFFELSRQPFQEASAHACPAVLQGTKGQKLVVGETCEARRLLRHAVKLRLRLAQRSFQQALASLLPILVHAHLKLFQGVLHELCGVEFRCFCLGRLQGLNLPAGLDHGVMSALQFLELRNQLVRELECLGLVEHEVPEEGVELPQVLGRLGLVQQPQGTLTLDAQEPPEALLIDAELVVGEGVRQVELETTHVEVVVGEELQLPHIELAFEHEVVALHIRRRGRLPANPEHLRQHHGTPMAITIGLGDSRPGGIGPKILRRVLTVLCSLLGPCTANIGQDVPVLAAPLGFTRSDVEVDPARRRHQCRVGVQDCGLPGAGVTDEQVAALRDRKMENTRERPPVEGLNLDQLELVGVASLSGKQVERRLHVFHQSESSPGSPVSRSAATPTSTTSSSSSNGGRAASARAS